MRQVPYTAMMKDTRSFIADDYRPTGVRFQDPRNMALNDIWQALQHFYRCQAESGPRASFRFSLFVGARRKNVFAAYPSLENPGQNLSGKRNSRKKDKGKQQEDALGGLLRIDESEETPTANPNLTSGGPANKHNQMPSELVCEGTVSGLQKDRDWTRTVPH